MNETMARGFVENEQSGDDNETNASSSSTFLVLAENLGPRLMGMLTDDTNDNDNDNASSLSSLTHVSPSLKISSDPSLVAHGRGLVATRDISAGELLFVHPPTVRAEISQVLRIYQNKAKVKVNNKVNNNKDNDKDNNNLLESIAETVLLKEMKRAIRGRKKQTSHARTAASFLALNGCHDGENEKDQQMHQQQQQQLQRVLLGKGTVRDTEQIFERFEESNGLDDNEYLLEIIRHNAFGPDFHHYHRMELELQANNNVRSNQSITAAASSASLYSRVLGHYPLAAMINHSCGPTNATRVFYGETMVASATMDISRGSEIKWPYSPPILPLWVRSERLSNGYGFSCRCDRCVLEKRWVYSFGGGDDESDDCDESNVSGTTCSTVPPPATIPADLNNAESGTSTPDSVRVDLHQWSKILKSLEVWYQVVTAKIQTQMQSNQQPPSQTARIQTQTDLLKDGLRLGYTQLYIRYFNQALQQQQQQESRAKILEQATQLHHAFSKTHNACTEHLSLLHLCYELSVVESTSSNHNNENSSNCKNKNKEAIRLWTERLKDAHLCRYSKEVVGRDLVTLKTVLKHTRTVLRTQDGWKTNDFCKSKGRNYFL